MLEKPALDDGLLIAALRDHYHLTIDTLTFLPLGADQNTVVYRATTDQSYFVKLRRGDFDPTSVIIPRLLHDSGVTHIIPPLTTQSGQLWTTVEHYHLMLYPFIEGHSGFEVSLSDQHWLELGRALKGVHTTTLPPALAQPIQREAYSHYWRDRVRTFQQQVQQMTFSEPVAARLAAFLTEKDAVVTDLITRAGRLAGVLKTHPLPFVLCHSDIHAGNVLVDSMGALYVVDWDQPILAPKERDLMFIGGGVGRYTRHDLDQQELHFYQGYRQAQVNPLALAYYRFERIVQDIAAYCEQLLLTDEGGQDREEGLQQLTTQFEPNAVIDIAYRTLQRLPAEYQQP